jgi:hypothetical protein
MMLMVMMTILPGGVILLQLLSVDFRSESFWQRGAYGDKLSNPWAGRPNAAPFDQNFYLIFNVAVGGYARGRIVMLMMDYGDDGDEGENRWVVAMVTAVVMVMTGKRYPGRAKGNLVMPSACRYGQPSPGMGQQVTGS